MIYTNKQKLSWLTPMIHSQLSTNLHLNLAQLYNLHQIFQSSKTTQLNFTKFAWTSQNRGLRSNEELQRGGCCCGVRVSLTVLTGLPHRARPPVKSFQDFKDRHRIQKLFPPKALLRTGEVLSSTQLNANLHISKLRRLLKDPQIIFHETSWFASFQFNSNNCCSEKELKIFLDA